jgi:hypothetical protein
MSNTCPAAVSPVWLIWDGDRVVMGCYKTSNSRSSCPICQKSCYSRDRFPFIGLTAVSFRPKGGVGEVLATLPSLEERLAIQPLFLD